MEPKSEVVKSEPPPPHSGSGGDIPPPANGNTGVAPAAAAAAKDYKADMMTFMEAANKMKQEDDDNAVPIEGLIKFLLGIIICRNNNILCNVVYPEQFVVDPDPTF
jgi:hypothetical protein